jgi:hypothetical protein
VIAYRAMLDVPRELIGFVSRLLNAERRGRGIRKRSRVNRRVWREAPQHPARLKVERGELEETTAPEHDQWPSPMITGPGH